MVDLDTLFSLGKRRGIVFPSSEIYGGMTGFWDYGPVGVELKRNIRDAWWRAMVQERDDIVGLDAAIILNPRVWEASGHVEGFVELLVECKSCRRRFRQDHLSGTVCPECGGALMEPRLFNTMLKTFIGPVESDAAVAYLRPETAQAIFVDFKTVVTTSRKKIPFGIAQVGKAFRNEITPGRFMFRLREFEQMELEFFVKPGTDLEWHDFWVAERLRWYTHYGIRRENLQLHEVLGDELAHYSKKTVDIFYNFPFGWEELEGIADRTDFDLTRHSQVSGEELSYRDEEAGETYTPYVIEPSAGLDRTFLAMLIDAYHEEPDKDGTRVVLKLNPLLAPYKVAILPLSRKEPLTQKARQVWAMLRSHFVTTYDDAQSIGRRYRRQDEIGTPYCVTIDFETINDDAVTVRDRDSMTQERVPVAGLVRAVSDRLAAFR